MQNILTAMYNLSVLKGGIPFTISKENYKVLRKYDYDKVFNLDGVFSSLGMVLDVETTGLSHISDCITEIGGVIFNYDPATYKIGEIVYSFSYFNDPKRPIKKEITDITGITNEMVKGFSIVNNKTCRKIESLFRKVGFIIAHNAAFDRKFVEKFFPTTNKIPWLCSMSDVNWEAKKMKHKTLEYLSLKSGFFFDGHRAELDAHATLAILHGVQDEDQIKPIEEVLKVFQQGFVFKVLAVGAPFTTKNKLKSRGYNFDGNKKVWYKTYLNEEEAKKETLYLCTSGICNKKNMTKIFKKIPLTDRFTDRE